MLTDTPTARHDEFLEFRSHMIPPGATNAPALLSAPQCRGRQARLLMDTSQDCARANSSPNTVTCASWTTHRQACQRTPAPTIWPIVPSDLLLLRAPGSLLQISRALDVTPAAKVFVQDPHLGSKPLFGFQCEAISISPSFAIFIDGACDFVTIAHTWLAPASSRKQSYGQALAHLDGRFLGVPLFSLFRNEKGTTQK